MGCPDENTLVALLTGALTAEQRDGLEEHIDRCSACQAVVAALARTSLPAGDDERSAAGAGDGENEPLAPGEIVDHYRVMRLEGWGGMGEVYLARDTRLGRKVALKILGPRMIGTPDEVEQLMAEARTIARFSHPHIVAIHDVGIHGGRPYLALEYVDGQSLRQRLCDGPPGPRDALRVSLAVAEALEEAHRNDVLHGDLKPENVLIARDGRPRVVDFGLARSASSPPEGADLGGTPAYMAPELWRGAPPARASDIWALGRVMLELATGRSPTAQAEDALASPELPEELRALIGSCLDGDPAARPDASTLRQRLEQLLRARPEQLGVDESPFRGLSAYSEGQARLFFGRDDEIAAFLERLRSEPVLSVVGPSGIGKSSFVHAGVIPRLKEQGRWTVLGLRPGLQPFQTLVSHLAAYSSGDQPLRPAEIGEAPQLLGLALQRIAAVQRSRVLLFVDQLEELLTLVADERVRGQFVSAVCTAADDPLDPVRVVLTLREDVLGQLAREPAARDALGRVTIITAPPPRALEQILVRPVEGVGYAYDDPTLVPEMVTEVQGEAACLPLVQFAGQMLWERRDRAAKLLRRADYRAIGGVAGALAQHADGVLAAMTAAERDLTRTALTRLVTPDGLRRVLTRAELIDGLGPGADAVVDRLTRGRLVNVRRGEGEEAELELAHEALLATWGQLRRWIDEGREELRVLADAEQAAQLWDRRGRKEEGLWSGAVLQEARGVLEHCPTVPRRVRQFVEAGLRRQRRRVVRKRALLVAAFAALAAVALGFAAKERESARQRRIAEDRRAEAQLASARAAWARGNLLEARAELRGSFETQDTASARILWWRLSKEPQVWRRSFGDDVFAMDTAPDGRTLAVGCGDRAIYLVDAGTGSVRRILRGHADQLESVAFSPDGRQLASAGLDGGVWIWEVTAGTGRALPGADRPRRSGIDRGGNILAFSPDGRQLAAGGRDGSVRLWRADTGTPQDPLMGPGAAVYATAFSPDGAHLAAGSADGQVRIWHVASRRIVHRLAGAKDAGAVHALGYSRDGRLLATGSINGTTAIWDPRSGRKLEAIPGVDTVQTTRFSPDGATLALGGGESHTLRLWDVKARRTRTTLSGHTALVTSVRFLPGDRRLASASMDRTVRLWDVSKTTPPPRHFGHGARVYGAGFSPDGRQLVTASEDWTARIWEVQTGTVSRVLRHPGIVLATTFSPDGKLIATSCDDRVVRLWDPARGRVAARLTGHAAPVLGLVFSPDGKQLATGATDGTALIWNVDSWTEAHRLVGHTDRIFDMAYSPDGARLASASLDGSLRLWETRTGRLLSTHTQPGPDGASAFFGVAFSPDGRRVATGGADRTVRVWELAGGHGSVVGRHAGRVYHLAFHPDGRIGAPDAAGVGRIWQVDSGRSTLLEGHRGEVNFLRFSPDGVLAATTGDDGTVRLWDTDTGQPRWRTVALLPGPPRLRSHRGWIRPDGVRPDAAGSRAVGPRARVASQDPESGLLCVVSLADTLELWDATGRRLARRRVPRPDRLLATPAGCLAVAGKTVRLYDRTGKARELARDATAASWSGSEVLVARGEQVLALSPDGRRLRVYAVGRGVTAVARAGERLILGYQDGNIALLPRPAFTFQGTSGNPVERLRVGPMGTLIAGHAGGQLGIWQLETGELLTHARLHGPVTHLLLEDQRLVVASELGDYRVWDLRALYASRCDLMREIWTQVAVVWRHGAAVPQGPPPAHDCSAR